LLNLPHPEMHHAHNKVTRLRAGRPGFYSQQGQGLFFLLATASGPVLDPTRPPIQ